VGDGFYVYALRCADASLYVGYSTDPERRLRQHNAGRGARYTRARRPVVLLRQWSFPSLGEALRFEYALKRLPKAEKERLVHRGEAKENAPGRGSRVGSPERFEDDARSRAGDGRGHDSRSTGPDHTE
jgi:putative endonuclease